MTQKELEARTAFLDARHAYRENPNEETFNALSKTYKAYEFIFNNWGH